MNFPAPTPSQPDRAMLGRSHRRFAPNVAKGAIVLADTNAARSTAVDKATERMTPQPSVRDVMLAAIPNLRAFAISLSGNADRADDLVQETVMRAMANIDLFTPGTNMSAWLFTILRNRFHSEYRKRRREVEDPDGSYLATKLSSTTFPPASGFSQFAMR